MIYFIPVVCVEETTDIKEHPGFSGRLVHKGPSRGFHRHGETPIAGWFTSWKILLKWDMKMGTLWEYYNMNNYIYKWMISGYPYFRKPPNGCKWGSHEP